MARHAFATTLGAALAAAAPLPPRLGRRRSGRARPVSRDDRRLLGLPYARRAARLARHEALSRRLRRRLRHSRRRRVRRPEPDARQGDRASAKWTDAQIVAAIRTGKTPDGTGAQPRHALAGAVASHRRGRAGDRGLSQEPPAGQQQGKNFGPNEKVTVPSPRFCRPTSTTRCPRRRNSAEPTAASQRHFGRKSRPTPLLTNWSV